MITNKGIEADLEILDMATPYIRSVLAFILYLKYGPSMGRTPELSIHAAYDVADLFIQRLKDDVKESPNV